MDAKKLQLFLWENDVEYHWHTNTEGEKDVFLMPYLWNAEELMQIMTDEGRSSYMDDTGMEAVLRYNYVVIEMRDFLEYFGIKVEDFFPPEDYDWPKKPTNLPEFNI